MSQIDWIEMDGKRYDERSVTRTTEYWCDSCGQPVTEPVILQVQLYARWQPASFPQLHMHPACIREQMPFLLPELSRQGINL